MIFQKGNQINKGRTPWNKGTKGIMKAWNKGKKCDYLIGNKYGKGQKLGLKQSRRIISQVKT